jgi:hypothetical protein
MEKVTIKDKTLGSLYYDKAWKKSIKVEINEDRYPITLIIESYDGNVITDIQRAAYKDYKKQQDVFLKAFPRVALEYYKKHYQVIAKRNKIPKEINYNHINQERIMQLVKPKSLLFKDNGEFGFICTCTWDLKNGLYIKLSGSKLIVTKYQSGLYPYV